MHRRTEQEGGTICFLFMKIRSGLELGEPRGRKSYLDTVGKVQGKGLGWSVLKLQVKTEMKG